METKTMETKTMETKFPNTEKVKKISFDYTQYCYCPMGKDTYKAKIHVEIRKPVFLFDYIEGTKFMESLKGGEFIIEKLARTIHDWFSNCVENKDDVTVVVDAESPTHFPVTVEA